MSKLQKISTERRRTALDDPAEAKAVKRLMVALQH